MQSKAESWVVVGSGLAGTLAAWQLHLWGYRVIWFCPPQPHTTLPAASAAAAGLVNLATGQKPGFTWQAQVLMHTFNTWLTTLPPAAQAAWHTSPIYRPFSTPAHLNDWYAASTAAPPALTVALHTQPLPGHTLHNPLGGVELTGGGWMDVPLLLTALRQHLRQSQNIEVMADTLTYREINVAGKQLTHGSITHSFDRCVFAEGIYVNANPMWPFRPLQPMKGELLRVRLHGMPALPFILIAGVYVLPCGNDEYLVGSTYQNHFTTPGPTPEGRADLLQRLAQALPGLPQPPEVLAHLAGVRPTTPDRRPVVGPHPEHPHLLFLNGLGTKGVLYGVWAASQLLAPLPELLPTRRTLIPKPS